MLQINDIRTRTAELASRLNIRGLNGEQIMIDVVSLEKEMRELKALVEFKKSEANEIAKKVGVLMKDGKHDLAEIEKKETATLKISIKELEETLEIKETKLTQKLYEIPNTPQKDVPLGKTPEDNLTILEWGENPILPDNFKPHWELTTKYDIVDFELGVKLTGAGFPVYKGAGARLQRALINFFLDKARDAGYVEILPPFLVNEASGIGTGQLPDKEDQMYYVAKDDLYLIPTAEVPVTNMYRNVILNEKELPIKNTAYTPCFRREAGSYGAHVRGLNRLHQFDKVEIVQITKPEESDKTLEEMQKYVQSLLQDLGLKYRVLLLCGGDMGFASAKTYDLEVWSAGQEKWLECSSVSNFETFQTNRLKCRYKNADGQNVLAHSLNGSALALPRIMAALIENYQTKDAILIPKVLHSYTGFDKIQ